MMRIIDLWALLHPQVVARYRRVYHGDGYGHGRNYGNDRGDGVGHGQLVLVDRGDGMGYGHLYGSRTGNGDGYGFNNRG